jgi:hypothetical protein
LQSPKPDSTTSKRQNKKQKLIQSPNYVVILLVQPPTAPSVVEKPKSTAQTDKEQKKVEREISKEMAMKEKRVFETNLGMFLSVVQR